MTRQVSVYVPGLFAGPDAPAGLLRLLARADHLPGGAEGDTRLFALFGVVAKPGQDLPVAAATRVADMGVIDTDWWIRADPVYLEPGRDSLVMHAPLDLSAEETEQLAAELNESLSQDGWLLKAPRPGRWYLKPPAAPAISTTLLAEAIGRNVFPLLPQGPDGKSWHTRLNELQILLHTSPVNAAREQRGALPANSVWFWGGGRLPEVRDAGWSQVWGAEPVSQGLARLAGIPAQLLPADGRQWLQQAELSGWQLLVLDTLQPALRSGDASTRQQAIQSLEQDWLAPLLSAIHDRRLDEITLLSESGPAFRYQRHHRWRFWRWPRALASYRNGA